MVFPSDSHSAEIAHVLFMDIVGYSQQPHEVQSRLVAELTGLVRATSEFQRAQAEGDFIVMPTGDGMALAFLRYPLAPVRCALEVARAAAGRPDLGLRMGLHTGPVSRVTDINGQTNLTGSGVNVAQRAMSSGDAGHILLSAALAQILMEFAQWRSGLRDLGECLVKHGERLHLYNLCLPDAGNPAVPSGIRTAPPMAAELEAQGKSRVGEPSGVKADARIVALLYKRRAPHSEHLITLLEEGLQAAGFHVFLDRHLGVGVEWAQELKRQVSQAYAVVPLLSAESIWSEMVEEEVQTAHEARQQRGDLPLILPVRVAYEDPLPEPLHSILKHLQYILWRGPEDDAALVTALVAALNTPRPEPLVLEPVGGAVPLDSRFYIVRPTDSLFLDAIARRDSIVLVKGARQMGKTSLLTRGLQMARMTDTCCFRTDFQKLTASILQSEETFFRALAEMICDQLDLDTSPDDVWKDRRPGAYNFERYLRNEALAPSTAHVVWALDEVDKLFFCPFGSDVFALFRSWHNDRSYEPDGPWSKLTMVIAYATEAHLFITDVNQSPFNIGTRLVLADFTVGEIEELNDRYHSPLRNAAEIARFHTLVGGQPYLSRRGLDQLAQGTLRLEQLEQEADRDEGIFGDHLRRLLVTLSQDAETLDVVRGFLRGEPLRSAPLFYRLRSGGLLAGESPEHCRLRCDMYRRYLERYLL
jgi:class 3 adenylate cyclase